MTTLRPARSDELSAIETVLRDAGLPVAGVAAHLDGFVVAEHEGAVVGCAGLERYGDAALLRSVAVTPEMRGTGLGQRLTSACIDTARANGIVSLALLTETAEEFFPKFGFVLVDRSELPDALQASEELRGACPASAKALLLHLSAAPR
jgi:amino-acid N-acetyltransferase